MAKVRRTRQLTALCLFGMLALCGGFADSGDDIKGADEMPGSGMADKEHNLPVKVMDKKLVLPQKKPKKPDPPPRPVAEIYAERVHPNLFILGEPKAGTTFLWKCLTSGMFSRIEGSEMDRGRYTVVHRTKKKEYFVYLQCKTSTIEKHMAKNCLEWPHHGERIGITINNDAESRQDQVKYLHIDGTPNYLEYKCAAENIKQYANQSQFVIMLREPLMRLYSNFEMFQAWGWEKNTDLLDVVNSQIQLIAKCEQEVIHHPLHVIDWSYEKLSAVFKKCFDIGNWKAYVKMSMPLVPVRYWLETFPNNTFYIIRTSSMKSWDTHHMIAYLSETFNLQVRRDTDVKGYEKSLSQCSQGKKPPMHFANRNDMLGNETLISNITHLHEILAANQDVLDIYLASAPNVILL